MTIGGSPSPRGLTGFISGRRTWKQRTLWRSARRVSSSEFSTHDEAELERGLAVDPDYVALGPIFPTISKDMVVAPQGFERLAEWKRRVSPLPLCAIGGLDLERAKRCLSAGADIVSVISDITLNADPEGRAEQWIAATRRA